MIFICSSFNSLLNDFPSLSSPLLVCCEASHMNHNLSLLVEGTNSFLRCSRNPKKSPTTGLFLRYWLYIVVACPPTRNPTSSKATSDHSSTPCHSIHFLTSIAHPSSFSGSVHFLPPVTFSGWAMLVSFLLVFDTVPLL